MLIQDLFYSHVEQDARKRADHDPLFDPLKQAVIEEAMKEHNWDSKALDYLVGLEKWLFWI